MFLYNVGLHVQLKDEEKSVLQQLATLESERKEVKRQIEVEKQKSKQLNEAEAKYVMSKNII